jgi:hypothetical protein
VPQKAPLLPRHLRVDDPTIPNGLIVWRELDPLEAPLDPQTNQRKIASSVFRTQEMSVRMSDHTTKAQVVANAIGCDLAAFTIGDARAVGCIVVRDPGDPAHGLIYDGKNPGNRAIPSGAAKRIRDRARHLTPPSY